VPYFQSEALTAGLKGRETVAALRDWLRLLMALAEDDCAGAAVDGRHGVDRFPASVQAGLEGDQANARLLAQQFSSVDAMLCWQDGFRPTSGGVLGI
jgi:hypothetical protein